MRKKVLQIGKFFPPDWGGIETATLGNIEVFDCIEGWDLDTVIHSNHVQSKLSSTVFGYGYQSIGGIPISLDLLKSVAKNLGKYHHVIIHVPNPIPLLLVLLKKREQTFSLYWHAPVSRKGPILTLLYNIFTRVLYAKFDCIIIPTSAHIETIPKYLHKKNFHFVDLFPTLELKNQSTEILENRRVSALKANIPYFVCAGRFVEYKGFDLALKAFSQLKLKYHNIEIVFIGSGPEYEKYAALTKRLGIEDSVTFLEDISNFEKLQMISGALCLIMPSISNQEMYGLAQIEAYACGIPVITTNLEKSGVPVIANASGSALVVQPGSVTELAAAMEIIHTNLDLRSAMGERARNYYLKNHDRKPIASQLQTFLRKFS